LRRFPRTLLRPTGHARFVDGETILFQTTSNPYGQHPQQFPYRVGTDGTHFSPIPTPFAQQLQQEARPEDQMRTGERSIAVPR
jgi:hypothetical protein